MFLFSWGRSRKPVLSPEELAARGGVSPCTAHQLWVFNNCVRTGAEHPATELNPAHIAAVDDYIAKHPEYADDAVATR